MEGYIKVSNLKVDSNLYEFINAEVLPGSGLNKDEFWTNFQTLINELTSFR